MNLLHRRPLTKDEAIKQYREWHQAGRITPVTAMRALGLFYSSYRLRFGALPITEFGDDLRHIEQFMRLHLADDPALMPFIIDIMFRIKNFTNVSTNALLNKNILIGWGIIEHAMSLRQKTRAGITKSTNPDENWEGMKPGVTYI